MSDLNSKIRQRISSDKLSVQNKLPSNSEGRNGDLRLTTVKGVNILFGKINGQWYNFGHGKKTGHRNKTALKEKVIDDHIRQLNLDSDLYIKKAKFSVSDLNYLTIDSKLFDVESSSNVSKLYIGDISLQPTWGTSGATIKLEDNEGTGFDLKIKGSNGVGTNKSGGDTILSAGYKTGTGTAGTLILGAGDAGTSNAAILDINATSTVMSGTLTIDTITETTSDTNKFLVSDSGVIKFVDDDTLIPDILTAGLNCSLDGSTLNVDDAFLINGGDDTTSGVITAGGFTTTGTITMPELTDDAAIGITKIQDSGTSFTDNDTSIMTAAAIADKIEGYSYSTASALNDLSDVTYSSGDLTITSLDTIISGALIFDSSGDLTFDVDGGDVYIKDTTSASQKPKLILQSTDGGSFGPELGFSFLSDSPANGDYMSSIYMQGKNDADGIHTYGKLYCKTSNVADGAEEATWLFTTSTSGTARNSLLITGKDDDTVDIDLGYGSGSVTTIAGDLTISGGNITNALTLDSTLTVSTINAVGSDTDKFLTSDSGVVKYVTGANLLSYIGGSSTTGTVTSIATTTPIEGGTITGTGTITHANTAGYKHIPTGGSSGEFLKYDSSGTAVWATPSYIADTNTTYSAGTNLTLSTTTFNVADAFLVNDDDDSTSGTITAGGFTTTGTWTMDTSAGGTAGITNINITNAFTDDDVTIMSAGAIKEKIEGYGYSTTAATNLTKTVSGSGFSINSSTGDNIALSLADTDNWGLMSDEMFDTLAAATTNTGTVTSVGTTGTVNGLTLTGTVTTSGNLTLGGTLAINNADWSGTDLAVANGGTGASSLSNLITLGTHTTGNYVATLTAGALIDLQNNSGETASPTIDVDLSELTDGTADVVGSADELVYLDASSQKRKQIDEIKLGQFNNDQGWTANAGDMTGVDLTGGTGISIDSETNTTSGAYSSTITCNLEGTELISTGEGGANKYLREDGDGSCSWQTVSASGNFVTDNADDTMAGTLTIDKDTTATTSGNTFGMKIDYDHTGITASGQSINNVGLEIDVMNVIPTHVGTHTNYGIKLTTISNTTGTSEVRGIQNTATGGDINIGYLSTVTDGGVDILMYSSADLADYFTMATTTSGATTLTTVDAGGEDANLTLDADGFIIFKGTSGGDGLQFVPHHSGRWNIQNNTQDESIYFFLNHGGSSTNLMEMNAEEPYVQFRNAGVGFDRNEATFSATAIVGSGGTDDTDIDFRTGNKFRLEMTGDITTVNLVFPTVSGNFVLVCRTDGDHDVTNWKVWESDESAATETDVMWSGGGSVPAFTTSGVDIVSFYWDADEQECYGVASLDFGT